MCSFIFNGVNCTAPGTSAYIFKMVELATFATPLSIHWAACQLVFLYLHILIMVNVFVVGFLSVCLTSFCIIPTKHFVLCKLLIITVRALWVTTLFIQANTFSLYM